MFCDINNSKLNILSLISIQVVFEGERIPLNVYVKWEMKQ